MKTKENLKQNRAITLIALVITIIILLILATIAIVELRNTNLFNKTLEARNKYKTSVEEENNTLDDYANKINKIAGGNIKTNVPTGEKTDTATDMVEYDAGSWTQEEINQLKSLNLYNINITRDRSTASGLNFTFGGFTYKGDTANASSILNGTITTSRNKSIVPESGRGTPTSDGWMVLEWGETSGTKKYVKKLVHAGAPENFVYYYNTSNASNDAYKAEYILSGGTRQTGYATYKPRSFDMYKDTTKTNMIEEVHCMTENEAIAVTGSTLGTNDKRRRTGAEYWLATAIWDGYYFCLCDIDTNGAEFSTFGYCFGIRPVITMKSGVYVDTSKHNGTGSDKYVLEMD